MELFCYQAECGDAIRIRYNGSDGNSHNVFFDSGYERTYGNVLEKEINVLIQHGEVVDLWIISHIHDDHIGGVIKYIKSINDGEVKDIVKRWLYNSPRNYTPSAEDKNISSAKSIRQGDILYDYLFRRNMLPEFDVTSDANPIDLFGLKITFLSPSSYILDELRKKYKDERLFERNEDESISQAKSTQVYDYHWPLEYFDLSSFEEDSSIENKSSISTLIEFNDKKILWLADSHPSDIHSSLVDLGFSVHNPLMCDFVIVSHHASKGNNNSQLFSIIKCNKYIISSNGENIHCLPTKEALSRIVRNKYRELNIPYNLYFTYDTPNLRSIFTSDDSSVYEKWNFVSIYSDKKQLSFLI